ncbi:FkbM family methyltransferase [Aliarcobacter cryaerophilus]|uniref:FkbM family methyltransferase n=1 Tax=Aliarcobacter cryaerophilus TaxID=28198 RepID=UPI0021B6029C|nr:FkbM family methyltransferase [Aliarcobacter cryaerophilus]MCT7516346.1 FkbM family methyltransferase [Aliarcobacter cryaerophilus]
MNIKRFSDTDYTKLQLTPRFEELEVGFYDCKIKVPDAASLLFLNHELFGLEIYKFNSEKTQPFIIDCGANIGLSVIYFKKLFPNAKVIAFEPDKKIFDYMKFNINSFGFKDVELINKGLWKEETVLKFFSEGADGGRIADNTTNENSIEIQTVKLSNYLNKEVQIDFLKLDIEGAETEVLLECRDNLNNVQNIFIEYHSFCNQTQTLSAVLNILESNGFRYYIEHIGVKSKHPFVSINNYVGFDNQLNIFGYRV